MYLYKESTGEKCFLQPDKTSANGLLQQWTQTEQPDQLLKYEIKLCIRVKPEFTVEAGLMEKKESFGCAG